MTITINRQSFNRYLENNFQAAKETLEKNPADPLAPWLAIATVKEDEDFESGNWDLHQVKFHHFDERRYALVQALGIDYGLQRKKIAAVYLVSEAWVSLVETKAYEAHPENRIPPSEDPDRQEAVLSIGMDIGAYVGLIQALIDRDENGHVHLQDPMRMDEGSESDLLKAFLVPYAMAYLEAGGKL